MQKGVWNKTGMPSENAVCNIRVNDVLILAAVYSNGKFTVDDVDITSHVDAWLEIPDVKYENGTFIWSNKT